jgi:hypothetical protein
MGRTVRTTIVGGRPPDDGLPEGSVPRGIEVLLKKASVDEAFRDTFLDNPEKAAKEISLELTDAERAMLRATPGKVLVAMVAKVRVPNKLRDVFLGKVAAVMVAALGTGLVGCGPAEQAPQPVGETADRPPKQEKPADVEEKPSEAQTHPVTKGATADKPAKKKSEAKSHPVTRGMSIHRPPKKAEPADEAS